MPTVIVTGGSGKLGQACVRDLVEHGWDVVNVDQVAPAEDIARYVEVDLTDYGQVVAALGAVDGAVTTVDAVVHLAAIPAPGRKPNAVTFDNNVPSTYHILEAARTLGITKVVLASSETVLGLPFDMPPPYAPVDEEYFPRPESAYSLGKLLEETMAAQYCRWNPELTVSSLRFSNVMRPEDYAKFESFQDDAALRKWNLWGYIDARDGAQAIRLALGRADTGFEAFIVANADTVMRRPSAELLAEVFPDVEVRGQVTGTETLLSIGKAQRILGFAPAHSWRDQV
ncbi:MAG TPA: NAD(P)-dependent oxidoreductase [Mycobacteriales bacterium]|jgi:nucleoside-diphosphate-sugar epimerase|nr:NAD(P)-dependent oxidoreductase [Mycobacteriales bacterium]